MRLMSMAAHMIPSIARSAPNVGSMCSANSARLCGMMKDTSQSSGIPRLEHPAFRVDDGLVLRGRKNVGVGSSEHFGRVAVRAVDPGVTQVDVLREHVDLGPAQRGLEPRLHQAELLRPFDHSALELAARGLELAQRRLVGGDFPAQALVCVRERRGDGSRTSVGSNGHRKATVTPDMIAVAALATPCRP